MKKIVANYCFGGFGVSEALCIRWNTTHPDIEYRSVYDFEDLRDNPDFIALVEEMGSEANGAFADLGITEIPDEATDWQVMEYDGYETVWYVLDGKMWAT